MANNITDVFEIGAMDGIKSCGVIIYRSEPAKSILLMRHTDRWDFPKGHVDPGETELQCALRELEEETGILPEQIELNPSFRFSLAYTIHVKKYNFEPREKKLILFLGQLIEEAEIKLTEHVGYEWFDWKPPHQIQTKSIDPAFHALEVFWKNYSVD